MTSDEPITPPASESGALEPAPEPIRKATPRKRDLTPQERVFLKQLKATTWIVDCQVTPPGYEGPKRAFSYLARYVAGVAISDQRLVSDSGGMVTISYKDYRAKHNSEKSNKYKTLALPVWEFHSAVYVAHSATRHGEGTACGTVHALGTRRQIGKNAVSSYRWPSKSGRDPNLQPVLKLK